MHPEVTHVIANASATATSVSNPRPAMKMVSARDSLRLLMCRERIDMNDSAALSRKISASMAKSLSSAMRHGPPGAMRLIDSTVMHTPTIVAEVGRMWAESPLPVPCVCREAGDGGPVLVTIVPTQPMCTGTKTA